MKYKLKYNLRYTADKKMENQILRRFFKRLFLKLSISHIEYLRLIRIIKYKFVHSFEIHQTLSSCLVNKNERYRRIFSRLSIVYTNLALFTNNDLYGLIRKLRTNIKKVKLEMKRVRLSCKMYKREIKIVNIIISKISELYYNSNHEFAIPTVQPTHVTIRTINTAGECRAICNSLEAASTRFELIDAIGGIELTKNMCYILSNYDDTVYKDFQTYTLQ